MTFIKVKTKTGDVPNYSLRKTIKEVLMQRDGLTEQEADENIEEAKEELNGRLAQGGMPYDICEEYFGLEPDYIEDLIG